jgi:prepilin-type N-terminal cleavage/methylation domain-containing protein
VLDQGRNGFSLIEVLIALSILAFGLLSIIALQTVSLKRNYAAFLHSVAVTQIASMFNRLEVDSSRREITVWNQNNAQLLPQGKGNCNSFNISLSWFSRYDNKKIYLKNDL